MQKEVITKIHYKQEKVWRGIKIQTPELSVKESEGETKGSEFVTLFMIEPFNWSAEDGLEPFSSHQGWWWE